MNAKIAECKKLGGTQINGADAVIVAFVKTENEKLSELRWCRGICLFAAGNREI